MKNETNDASSSAATEQTVEDYPHDNHSGHQNSSGDAEQFIDIRQSKLVDESAVELSVPLLSPLHSVTEGGRDHNGGVKSLNNSHNLGVDCPLESFAASSTQRSSLCSGLKSLYGLIEEADAADTMVTMNSQNGSTTMLSTSYSGDFKRAPHHNDKLVASLISPVCCTPRQFSIPQSPSGTTQQLIEFDTLSDDSADEEV